jgi:hypothetical protein
MACAEMTAPSPQMVEGGRHGLAVWSKTQTRTISEFMEFEEILAILVLAVICFIAGLIVRTRVGLRAKNAMERRVLQRLPS